MSNIEIPQLHELYLSVKFLLTSQKSLVWNFNKKKNRIKKVYVVKSTWVISWKKKANYLYIQYKPMEEEWIKVLKKTYHNTKG